jgi:tetratricopeptide (TPR) repeat protein
MRALLRALVLLGLIAAPVATAADDWADCRNEDLDRKIRGCTRIISAARDSKQNLSTAYGMRGWAFHKKRDHDRAIADLNEAIRYNPKNVHAHNERSRSYYQKREFDRAIADASEAVKLDANYVHAYANRGRAHRGKGDLERAMADFEEAIRRKRDYAFAYLERGRIHRLRGEHDRAMADFNEAIRLDPTELETYLERGVAYREMGDYERAIGEFNRVIRLNPNLPDGYYQRGIAHANRGEYDKAIADYDQTIRLDPTYTAAYTNRGRSYLAKGDADRAKVEFRAALALPAKYIHGAWAHKTARSSLEALEFSDAPGPQVEAATTIQAPSEPVLAPASDPAPIPSAVAVIEPSSGDWADCKNEREPDRAIPACTRLIAIGQDTVRAYHHRAKAHRSARDYERALADVDHAIKLNSGFAPSYHVRGHIYQDKGDYDRAIAEYSEAIRVDAGFTAAYTNRGLVYLAKGDPDRAKADFRAALAVPPKYENGERAQRTARAQLAALDAIRPEPAKAQPESPSIALANPDTKSSITAAPSRRVALVVGNSAYEHATRLENPERDARGVASAFRRLGFAEVVEKYDLTLKQLLFELRAFEDRASGADWAVVYYAGHGIEVGGTNYLIPVDARLERANDTEDEALPLERVVTRVAGARKLRLVVLDACRNNPFATRMLAMGKTTRAIGRGLAGVEPQAGVLVAYAARDGQLAIDGTGGANSPYAGAFIKHLEEPGLEIGKFFRKVRDSVLAATGGAQQPFEYGSLPGEDFYFKTGP